MWWGVGFNIRGRELSKQVSQPRPSDFLIGFPYPQGCSQNYDSLLGYKVYIPGANM